MALIFTLGVTAPFFLSVLETGLGHGKLVKRTKLTVKIFLLDGVDGVFNAPFIEGIIFFISSRVSTNIFFLGTTARTDPYKSEVAVLKRGFSVGALPTCYNVSYPFVFCKSFILCNIYKNTYWV